MLLELAQTQKPFLIAACRNKKVIPFSLFGFFQPKSKYKITGFLFFV